MRLSGLLLAALSLGPLGARGQAPDPGVAPDGLPGALRVGHLPPTHRLVDGHEVEAPPSLAVVGTTGYGLIESDGSDGGAHHRLLGEVALSGRPIPWLSIAAGLRGRYDVHPADAMGGDDSAVGSWWLGVRGGGSIGGGLSLGADARLDVLGGDAPDVAFLGSMLTLRAMASFAPPGGPLTLSFNAGYRFDGSGNTFARTGAPLRRGDRVSLGVSDSDAFLLGAAASVRLDPVEILGELTWEPWTESTAPDLGRAPLRIAGGARMYATSEVALSLIVELTLQSRVSVELTQPLAPVEPRFAGLLTVAWRPTFGGAPATVAQGPVGPTAHDASGRVTDGEGAPIAGAQIRATPAEEGEAADATTDASGRFVLHDLTPGHYQVEASADGYRPSQAELQIADSSPAPLAITLEHGARTGTLRGLVRDFRGRPVDGASIRVDGELAGRTDSDGVFSIDVEAGEHAVQVSAEGFADQDMQVEVELDGVTVVNADLRRH